MLRRIATIKIVYTGDKVSYIGSQRPRGKWRAGGGANRREICWNASPRIVVVYCPSIKQPSFQVAANHPPDKQQPSLRSGATSRPRGPSGRTQVQAHFQGVRMQTQPIIDCFTITKHINGQGCPVHYTVRRGSRCRSTKPIDAGDAEH